MIKNIILDMGNVLLRYDPAISLNRYCHSDQAKELILRELFQGPEWIAGDYGHITNAEKFLPVSKRLPEKYHKELRDCVDHWTICMQPISGAREFCLWAREQGYKLYVLSNADDTFHSYFSRLLPESFFDGIMVSCEEHTVKPERKIYQLFLDRYGLSADECLFIDDRQENIEGAQALGIHTSLFCGTFEELKKSLPPAAGEKEAHL